MWTFLYRAAWAAGRLAAPWLAAGNGKLARSVRGRRDAAGALVRWASLHRDTSRPLAWFHAASVGEGRQAEAVLVRLRAARPDVQIVYTHASASAEALARGLPADVAGYVPADTVADTSRALEALRPAVLVFAATDVWPELVRQASARGVRTALVSAMLAPGSSRRGGLAAAMLRDTFARLDAVAAVGDEDAAALIAAGARADRVSVTGDTRHDAAAARAARLDRAAPHLRAMPSDRPVLVAGSTWPADERVLLAALAILAPAVRPRLVIAPHEPDPPHLDDLERRLRDALPGQAITRLSRAERETGPWDTCVVDRVGVLAELYAAAAFAFVGGGFHDKGLHSVIEPAALGVPVLFGPRWRNSRDAGLLLAAGGARSVADARALATALGTWLSDDAARRTAGAAARAVVDRGLGAADRSLGVVLTLLDGSR